MHLCLRMGEILRHVASDGETSTVTLACCCKDFEDLVLDAPWETQGQLTPLFETLLGDVWYHGECGVSVPMIFLFYSPNHSFLQPFRRLPTMQKWVQLRGYTRRMRRIEEGGDLYLLPSEFLSVLRFRAFNEPLLPNMKYLNLDDVAENLVSFIPLFLPPRITSIDLNFGPSFLEGVVASIVPTFPRL